MRHVRSHSNTQRITASRNGLEMGFACDHMIDVSSETKWLDWLLCTHSYFWA